MPDSPQRKPAEHSSLSQLLKAAREKAASEPKEQAIDDLARLLRETSPEDIARLQMLQSARERVLGDLPDEHRENQELYEAALRRLAAEQTEREEQEVAELLDQAVRWLENKWAEQPCPYCQHIEWQVGTPLEVAVGEDDFMSPAFPVMCGNCGHTTFVNAIRAGLVPDDDTE